MGSFPWIKGLSYEPDLSLASSMNGWSYTYTPIICPAGMYNESFTFMMCWKSHCPLHVEKIHFFYYYYARNNSCGKLYFIYMYLILI
jgi:hypothetical protein